MAGAARQDGGKIKVNTGRQEELIYGMQIVPCADVSVQKNLQTNVRVIRKIVFFTYNEQKSLYYGQKRNRILACV